MSAAAEPLPAIQNMRITLTVWPRRLPYSSASAVQVLPLRRYCVAISPESLSCWSAQAPRTYEARLRSRPLRSASRAAALKSTRFGGTSKADIASSKVDLPEPERPTNRKPRSAIGTSTRPLNVPQLNTCNRRMRNCSSRGSGRADRNSDGATGFAARPVLLRVLRGALFSFAIRRLLAFVRLAQFAVGLRQCLHILGGEQQLQRRGYFVAVFAAAQLVQHMVVFHLADRSGHAPGETGAIGGYA